jgi:hypothetical protein
MHPVLSQVKSLESNGKVKKYHRPYAELRRMTPLNEDILDNGGIAPLKTYFPVISRSILASRPKRRCNDKCGTFWHLFTGTSACWQKHSHKHLMNVSSELHARAAVPLETKPPEPTG